jgi:hypothetical protein
MKFILIFICLLAIEISQAYGREFLILHKINEPDLKKLKTIVKTHIVDDMGMNFPAHFDDSQSFKVVGNGITQFNLVPVAFNSRKAKNNICLLSVFSAQNVLLSMQPLHYIQGDGDEIVESCIGVLAVTLTPIDNVNSVIYLIRNRSGNRYGDTAFIGSINSGGIKKNEAISNCVSNYKDLNSLPKVQKAIKQCCDSK